MNFSKLCRACMKEFPRNDMEICDQSSMDMFLFCTRIQVSEENDLPKHFCSDCNNQLKTSYQFIKHAHEVNDVLQNLIFQNRGIKDAFDVENNNDHSEPDDQTDIKLNDLDNLYETAPLENKQDGLVQKVEVKTEVLNLHLAQNKGNKNLAKNLKTRKIVRQRKVNTGKVLLKQALKSNSKYKIEDDDNDFQNTDDYTGDETTLNNLLINKKNNENTEDFNTETSRLNETIVEDNIQEYTTGCKTSKSQTFNNIQITACKIINDSDIEIAKNKFTCPICHKVYSSDLYLKKHIKTKHKKNQLQTLNGEEIRNMKVKDEVAMKNRELKYCPMCNKSFKLQTHFNKHVEKQHLASKQYFCPYCPTICESAPSLRCHKSLHAEDKRFACSACGKRFRLRKGLAAHALTHSDHRPFKCDCCHMAFKMKQVLIKHMSTHDSKHSVLCHICAKGFKHKHALQEHMASHTGERSFACAQCGYRCKYRSSLALHARRHAALREHHCTQCQKAFYERATLSRHMRIHTGEKPFRCPSCPLAFIDHWKRKTHIMRVHQVPFDEIPRLAADGQPITKW